MTSSNLTSSSLLLRASQRDPDAWQRLVSLYQPLVYHWCYRGGLHNEDIHDVAQEVFRAVAVALGDQMPPPRSFRGWLRGVTRHKLFDYFRARGREPEAVGGTDAYRSLQQVPEPPENPVEEEREVATLYHRALEMVRGEFEPRTWQAFWRTAVDGESPRDVAAELGMSPGAVRVAKSRVLRRLREEMGELIN
jgi:RNA polymerase sigma-70 factor (ECF subfamily)